jgi:hypothetical protein
VSAGSSAQIFPQCRKTLTEAVATLVVRPQVHRL